MSYEDEDTCMSYEEEDTYLGVKVYHDARVAYPIQVVLRLGRARLCAASRGLAACSSPQPRSLQKRASEPVPPGTIDGNLASTRLRFLRIPPHSISPLSTAHGKGDGAGDVCPSQVRGRHGAGHV
jgi:hypothetical protein